MHWNETNELNIKLLHRIVALLLALADLADRAGGRSLAVRCAVLWLLGSAEEIASDYVAALTGDLRQADQTTPMAVRFAGDGPADAARLAQAFRALAVALAAFLTTILAAQPSGIASAGSSTLGRSAIPALVALFDPVPAVEIHDSS